MPTLRDVLQRATTLRVADIEWLHLLVEDWQLLSDLSFADLVLWVRIEGRWTVATHVRPNTGPLVFSEDLVGTTVDDGREIQLDQCEVAGRIVSGAGMDRDASVVLREESIPVTRQGRIVAVLTRHSNPTRMRTPSALELTYRSSADTLARMIAAGEFPMVGAPMGLRSGAPRVGDGVIRLDIEGIITYASPNATSALHRLGYRREIVGDYLSRIAAEVMEDHSIVDESLVLVVTGRAPWRSEIESHGASVSLRALPLLDKGERIGAVVLLRDVSELRRRERELLTKDATIREIHHRVKNNLQTVAALLRLQARRVDDQGARTALADAGRRVTTIALVHDTLSRTLDASVDFDEIAARGINAVVEVTDLQGVRWELRGSFGQLVAEDATAIALIVTELVQNAIEHAFGPDGGTVTVEVHRREGDELVVEVIDDGQGLPAHFRPGASGLGTQIVRAFVQDLRGDISWERRQPHGTLVRFVARLRRRQTSDGG